MVQNMDVPAKGKQVFSFLVHCNNWTLGNGDVWGLVRISSKFHARTPFYYCILILLTKQNIKNNNWKLSFNSRGEA